MINLEDQNRLFLLISDKLKRDLECISFGGTAMMYKGYKDSTKDIDLVFMTDDDRKCFAEAIKELGYEEKNIFRGIYPMDKSKLKTSPQMFTRGEERFDLFAKFVFKTELSSRIIARSKEIRDFNQKRLLRIRVLSDEDLILLKAITERDKDYFDIEAICKNNPKVDWKAITEEAIEQAKKGDNFIVLDLEETMQKLKKDFFIKKEHFERLYKYL